MRAHTKDQSKMKIVLLVAIVLTTMLGALIWKNQSSLLENQRSFVLDSAMKQIAPLKRLVSETLENEKNDLVRFATAREALGAGHANSFGDFDAIALVEPSGTQWLPTWIEKSAGLRPEKWPQGYDLTLLKSLPYAKVHEGTSLWVRLSDAQGAPLFAVLDSVTVQGPTANADTAGSLPSRAAVPAASVAPTRAAILVGFAQENPLASATEDYLGSTNAVYIVDDRGYVASHVRGSYAGSTFAEDPLTKDIVKTQKLAGTKQVIDMDGRQVLGHFERIEHSNLTAVIETPVEAVTALASEQLHSSLMFGIPFILLAMLLAWFVTGAVMEPTPAHPAYRPKFEAQADDKDEEFTQASLSETSLTELPAGASFHDPVARKEALLLDERKNAFEAYNAGMAARLREPLLAILGHAQLVKTKAAGEADIVSHVESIEREARLAKDALERFQVIEENETSLFPRNSAAETCDLEKAVLGALAEKMLEIDGSGIELEQSLTHVPRVHGRAGDIENAVMHLIDNAIESMRDRPDKRLTLQLSWLGDTILFLIKDSGIGMTRDIQARAFEPFFKGFASPRHMGLGLSFVQTTLKSVGATSQIDSTPGGGTLISIEFPVDAEAKREFEAGRQPPDLRRFIER